MKIAAFGEILFDVIEGEAHLGGAPLNFAGHLQKLGADSMMLSRLGKDELGQVAIEKIRALGVDDRFVQWDETHPTGRVEVVLKAGQPDYTIIPNVAYDYIAWDKALQQMPVDVLYVGTLAQRNEVSRNSLRQIWQHMPYQKLFYDVNFRKKGYAKEWVLATLEKTDIVKLNDEEVAMVAEMNGLSGEDFQGFCQELKSLYPQLSVIIITAGAKGSYIDAQDRFELVPGQTVQVVDTVGAGDSFSAAFVYQFLQHGNAFLAAKKANRLGSFVASSRGALPNYPPVLLKELQEI